VSEQSAAGKEVGPPKFLSQVKTEAFFHLFYVIFNLTLMINAFFKCAQAVLNSLQTVLSKLIQVSYTFSGKD
jgi:hypothetical protein